MKRVLFVCTGNICRSPTAEGVARAWLRTSGLEREYEVDSAGTHDYHIGEAPDRRTCRAAQRRGYDLSPLRARSLQLDDYIRFDLLLAMDRGHLQYMLEKSPPVYRSKIKLFMSYARFHAGEEVDDPYYGGEAGFERVLDMCEDAVQGLFESLQPVRADLP